MVVNILPTFWGWSHCIIIWAESSERRVRIWWNGRGWPASAKHRVDEAWKREKCPEPCLQRVSWWNCVASWVAKLDDRLHGEPGGSQVSRHHLYLIPWNKPYKVGPLPAINGLRTPISMVFFTPGKPIYFRPLIGAYFDDFTSFLTIGSGLVPCPNCWTAWLQSFLFIAQPGVMNL